MLSFKTQDTPFLKESIGLSANQEYLFKSVLQSMESSLCFGIFEGEKQIGYARVISDFTTFAYLCDVFTLEEHRGRGSGTFLMECPCINGTDEIVLSPFAIAPATVGKIAKTVMD